MDGFIPPANPPVDTMAAVESLVRRYGDWLKERLRRRYGDRGDELAHEALLRTAAHEDAGAVTHPKAFLLTVADNLAIDRARQARREQLRTPEIGALAPTSTPAIQEEAYYLKQIVLALPPELRDALVLTKIKGLSYRDVAALTGTKERTVKDRVRRALIETKAMREMGRRSE